MICGLRLPPSPLSLHGSLIYCRFKKIAIMKQAFPVSNPLLCERRSVGMCGGGGGEKNLQQRGFFSV